MQVGDTVNLVRKITGELLPVTLDKVLTNGTKPAVEVIWRSPRHRYKLDLVANEVLAIDSTPGHRQSMRAWYLVSEPHREALTLLFWSMRKKGR